MKPYISCFLVFFILLFGISTVSFAGQIIVDHDSYMHNDRSYHGHKDHSKYHWVDRHGRRCYMKKHHHRKHWVCE